MYVHETVRVMGQHLLRSNFCKCKSFAVFETIKKPSYTLFDANARILMYAYIRT